MMTLEDYGFCRKGEGGKWVEGGRVEVGGELPINTSGGLLSETGMPGLQLVMEGVRQMRGTSVNQVKGAEELRRVEPGRHHAHALHPDPGALSDELPRCPSRRRCRSAYWDALEDGRLTLPALPQMRPCLAAAARRVPELPRRPNGTGPACGKGRS